MTTPQQLELFIRLPEVRQRVGMSKSQIYKLISQDQFPKPVKVSRRISCWVAAEVDSWIKNKIQTRDRGLLH
jgi:prophage regulatory protein